MEECNCGCCGKQCNATFTYNNLRLRCVLAEDHDGLHNSYVGYEQPDIFWSDNESECNTY